MAPPTDQSRLGAIGFPEGLLVECQQALSDVASLEPIVLDPDRPFRSEDYDALAMVLSEPLTEGMATFSNVRRQHPLVPLLVLAGGVDGNFGAEILKCGADDFLLLPPRPEVFRHKVQRVFGETTGAAFDTPEFSAFHRRGFDINERRCFRVHVTPDFAVQSLFPGPIERPLDVKDLSIETEHAPGGLQVAAERAMARRLPFDQWQRRGEIDLVLQLPTGSPIKARGRLIPGLRNAIDGSIRFAVEYWLARPAEKERFRRYWVEAQRRMRRGRK